MGTSTDADATADCPNKRVSREKAVTHESWHKWGPQRDDETAAITRLRWSTVRQSMASCSAFATREKSGEITPACVRWLGRDVREATTTKDRDFIFVRGALRSAAKL